MQVRTEVEIDAPPAEVWKVLCDFERYTEWNPLLVRAGGEARQGARIEIVMSLPDSDGEHRFRPLIVKLEPERELRWLGHLWFKGLFDGEHFFRLDALDGGRTRLVHGEDFNGLFVRFAGATITRATRGFVYMNQALKRRVESKVKQP